MKVFYFVAVLVSIQFGGFFLVGLFNFARLAKAERKNWLSFHCDRSQWYWRIVFPVTVCVYGFLSLLFRCNPDKECERPSEDQT